MRFAIVLSAASVMAGCSAVVGPSSPGSPTPSVRSTPTPPTATPLQVCHGLAHVYNPSRVHVLAACVSVRGSSSAFATSQTATFTSSCGWMLIGAIREVAGSPTASTMPIRMVTWYWSPSVRGRCFSRTLRARAPAITTDR